MRNKSLISFVMLLVLTGSVVAVEKTFDAKQEWALELYSAAPAVFIENVGQISDPMVCYVFRGSGANIFHTTKGPIFQLFKQEKLSQHTKHYHYEGAEYSGLGRYVKNDVVRRTHIFSMRFIGANGSTPIGHGERKTKVNYFISGDPNKWYTDIATYSEVVYPELYDGISLHTFGRRSHLKYEFHIAAGADYRKIVVTYKGAGIKIDSNGALHVSTPLGELLDAAPYIYQIINDKYVQIPGRYCPVDENSYMFEITGIVEPTFELVIDPHLSWASYLGGSGNESGYGIAVDATGNSFLTGATDSSDFPTTPGVYQGGYASQTDAFVAKIGSGGQLLWMTYLGGSGDDVGYGIAVDSLNYVLLTGNTDSPTYSFPTTYGAFQRDNQGGKEAFVTKLNSFGSGLFWSSLLGGSGDDSGYSVAVDFNDAVLLTGDTNSTDFPTTPGKPHWEHKGQTDAFVAKVIQNPQGYPILQWCQCRGGSDEDAGYAIAVDVMGSSLVIGATASHSGFSTTNQLQSYGGGTDVFVAKLDTFGNIEGSIDAWGLCSYLGGSADDEGYGIDVGQDSGGRYALLTGYTTSSDFPSSGGFDSSYCCYSDAFVTRINYTNVNLDPVRPKVVWSSYLGGGLEDVGRSIAIASKGEVFPFESDDYAMVTGITSSYNFPTPEGFDPNYNGGEDAFVTKVTSSGQLIWSSYLGGSGNDHSYGVAVDGEGSVLLTGLTDSNDFPARGEGDNERNGGEDAFVSKISKDKMIGSGKLHGTVWDPNGVAIADANVIAQGQMVKTNVQGHFSFDSNDANHPLTFDLFAGQTIVMVTKDTNYYPVAKIVTIDVNSTTLVNIQMTSKLDMGGPQVVEVHSKYCGPGEVPYYLHGPSLREKFVATIDWGQVYDPNKERKIVWETPRGQCQGGCEDIISGGIDPRLGRISHHGRCFDMGNDFGVGNNWLKVTAIAYQPNNQELNSGPKEVNSFEVIAPPSYIDVNDANDPNVVKVIFTGNGFEYKILLPGFDLATWDSNKVETGMPLFGGEMMNVGARFKDKPGGSDSKLVGRVNSDGTSDVYTEGSDGTSKREAHLFVPCAGVTTPKLPSGIKVKVYSTADFFFAWDHSADDWGVGGALNVGCLFNYTSPPYYLPPVGGVPPYAKYAFDLDFGLRGELVNWTRNGPEWATLFYFEPLCKGILGAGFADNLCVEGHFGGGFHGEIQLLPTLDWGDHYIVLVGGVKVIVGSVTVANAQLRYCWWPNPGMHDMSIISGFQVLDELEDGGDYYHNPGCSAVLGYNEDIIEPNEFPYCVPKVVPIGEDMLVVWLQDNRNRSYPIHRTELKSIRYDETWSGKQSVDNDDTADMNPHLIELGNGDAVCIWQDAKSSLDNNCGDVETFNKNLEISVKKYSNSTRNWEVMTGLGGDSLTDDGFLDRSPRLAVDESDASNMLAVWISNQDGNTWGDSTAVNKIKWRKYSGGWDGSNTTMVANFGMILGMALVYKDGTATYVFCKDGDNDINTPADQTLWKMTYSDSTSGWTDADWLTNDGNDTSPSLVYDGNGNLLLFWVKGDDICMAKGNGNTITRNDVDQAEVVVTPGGSIGSKDFDLVRGDRGQIALVWNDVSTWSEYPKLLDPNHFDPERIDPCFFDPIYDEQYRIPRYINPNYTDPNHVPFCHDIWISYYEPDMDVWSMPRQLTWDDSAERFISASFEADGTLLCVYNKRQTEYQTIDYNEPDGDPKYHIIHVESIPKSGRRSDVVCLRDDLKCDLSIEIEDVSLEPANPMQGTWASVSANVKNVGISPASNFKVVFSDCNVPFATVFVAEDYVEGDLDLDGDVDMRDVTIFINRWLELDCGPWNKWCQGSDIDNSVTVNFGDFEWLAKNWSISAPPQILVGGGEIKVSANWQVPETSLSRTMSVQIIPDDIQDDANNNTVSFDVLLPDLIISEVDAYIAGPNSIVTVRVANKGVLPAYDPNNQVKVSLMPDVPGSAPLQEKFIRCVEPMSYHDVQFILEVSRPYTVHAVVDPNEVIEEFNEGNNIRRFKIR